MSFLSYEQECLLAVMAFDDTPGGCVTAATLLPVDLFDRRYQEVVRKTIDYVHHYKKAPGEHFFDLVQDVISKQPEKEDDYQAIFDSVTSVWEKGVNRVFVFDRARLFGKHSRLRQGVGRALEHLNTFSEETVLAAEKELKQSMDASYGITDFGIHTHSPQFTRFIDNPNAYTFLTGIPELDQYGLGPSFGQTWMMAGKYGKGKSWSLQELAAAGVMMNPFPVLYCPLEMTEDECAKRFAMILHAFGDVGGEIDVTRIRKDEKGLAVGFRPAKIKVKSFQDPDAEKVLTKKMQKMLRRPRLYIKAFAPNTLTIDKLEGFLDALHGSEQVTPRLVIIDYTTIMKIDKNHRTEHINEIVLEFNRIAYQRNLAMAAAMQLNRGGAKNTQADGSDLAGAYDVTATVHKFFAYNQSDMEAQLGIARLKVDKARGTRSGFEVLISQCYAAGRFVVSSAFVGKKHKKMVEEYAGENDDTEESD